MSPTTITTERLQDIPRQAAVGIVDGLPGGGYTDYYQPYRNPLPSKGLRGDLINAVHELHHTQGVTTKANVLELRNTLAGVATGGITDPVIITGRCSEPVDAEHYTIESLVKESLQMLGIAKRGLGNAITILRNRGQNGKPRTLEFQTVDDGHQVLSHYGDMINGADEHERDLDPSRLVSAAVQARDVEMGLTGQLRRHVPAAHEALMLPYEQSFIRPDDDGNLWSEAADLLWLGDRTRRPDGPHVEMLSKIENPIGVKLGPTATPADVKALYDKLSTHGNCPAKLSS